MSARPRLLRVVLAGAVALLLHAAAALASTEVVKNGLFTDGRDGKPAQWSSEGYLQEPAATQYTWAVDEAGLGTISIASSKPDDARWVQSVPVSPSTWYQVTGWIRAENVGAQTMGVYLSIMDTFYNSRDLRGTTGWQPVELWVKTGRIETTLRLACRLGGYSSLNTGTAHCAGLSVVAAGTPRAGAPFVHGGTPGSEAASGLPIVQGVAVLVVVGVLLLVWRYLAPASARIPP